MKNQTRVRNDLSMSALLALMLAALGFAVGCNTVDGMGDDLKSASEETSEAIDDATD